MLYVMLTKSKAEILQNYKQNLILILPDNLPTIIH
jgi:hypothetical protein